MQQVLSRNCDLGLCGPEQTIYIYNQKREDYTVIFGQLTHTDGSFLVGRKKETDFEWENLKGKSIIGGRPGGIPEMALESALKNHGITPGKDCKLITNIAYTATSGAFTAGTGDYVALFEPTGSMLEKNKSGYIVASIGKSVGVLPETCFFAAKSYIEKNPSVVQKFMNAIYEGQVWVQNHSNDEIAKEIESFFPDSDLGIITNVVKNYKDIGVYSTTSVLKDEDMNRFMDIIQSYDSTLITKRPPLNKIVNNTFAEKAIKNFESSSK